jgi:aspartate carbamoyltransferase catalytic subunit
MNGFPSVLETIRDLSKDQIDGLLSLSFKLKSRELSTPVFKSKKPIIATSFLENSTRTKHSFNVAVQNLGAFYIDFNADASSLKKGETLQETLMTLHCQGVDLCIIRTSVSMELTQFKERPPIRIINGGDGTHQHPTQALLDLMTLQEDCPNLEGKTLSIIGDWTHSRVGHSLVDLLRSYGVKVILCGPTNYLPNKAPADVELSNNLEETVKRSDFLYSLRIQKERHTDSEKNDVEEYHEKFGLNLEKLKSWNKLIPVYHPGPVNIGVELAQDIMNSSLYMGYKQVQNSVYMRMAIIQAMLENRDKNIGVIDGVAIGAQASL